MVATQERGAVMTKALGAYVRERRKAMGDLSQEYVAHEIGKTQEWVSRLERGSLRENMPNPLVLDALARALGVTPQMLMEAAGYPVGMEPEPRDDVQVYTAMMHDVDLLNLPAPVKRHLKQTIEFARDLSRQNVEGSRG